MARKDTAADAANPGRLKQIALTYKMTRRADKKIGLVLAAVGIGIFGVFLAIGFLLGHPIYLGILGPCASSDYLRLILSNPVYHMSNSVSTLHCLAQSAAQSASFAAIHNKFSDHLPRPVAQPRHVSGVLA